MTEVFKEVFDSGIKIPEKNLMVATKKAEEIRMIPLEGYTNKLGFEVKKIGKGKSITILKNGGHYASIEIGSTNHIVNGKSIELSSVPIFKKGVVYVPRDFFEKVLNAVVAEGNGKIEVATRAKIKVN